MKADTTCCYFISMRMTKEALQNHCMPTQIQLFLRDSGICKALEKVVEPVMCEYSTNAQSKWVCYKIMAQFTDLYPFLNIPEC